MAVGEHPSSRRAGGASNRRTSTVYRYIKEATRVDSNGGNPYTVFYCQVCVDNDSPRLGEWASANTSNFKTHIRTYHPREFALIEIPPHTASRDDSALVQLERVDQDRATRMLARWLVRNSHPFLLVDQELFREFCAILNPTYRVPCRQTIRTHVLKTWATEKSHVRSQILADLHYGCRASVTTDLWTSAAKHGYCVVTLQYINADWVVRSVILGFVRVVYRHGGDRLAKALATAVDLMDPRISAALWTVTADNASNNRVMTSTLQQDLSGRHALQAANTGERINTAPRVVYIRCIAHVFQLAVKEGLKKSPDINTALGGLREVVRKFSDSPKLFEKYEEVCQSLFKKARKFKLDVETRWNSTFIMLRSLLLAKPEIEELLGRIEKRQLGYTDFLGDVAVLQIQPEAWAAARLFRAFLGPFKEATTLMSGRYPTLSAVPSVYTSLQHHVTQHVKKVEARLNELRGVPDGSSTVTASTAPISTTTSEIASGPPRIVTPIEEAAVRALKFFKGAQEKLQEYQFVAATREARIAASLDPRFKVFTSPDVYALIIEEFKIYFDHRFAAECEREAATRAESRIFSPPSKFPRLMQLMVEASGSSLPRRTRKSIEEEVEDWFKEPGVRMDLKSSDVCAWFRTSASGFPRLRMMAREFLAIPATSVPSEIAFSAAGNTIRDRRACLSDESVTAISELQSYIKFNMNEDQEPDSEDDEDDEDEANPVGENEETGQSRDALFV